jgi:glycosyltransferase involved in cell wall biosynthesis
MVAQTRRPAEWVLVDDGSSDRTAEIAEACAAEHPFVRVLRRRDRGHREAGAGVIQAFYAGFESLATRDWEFVVKLDADLSFAPDYFERCLERFAAEPRLGIAGGVIYNRIGEQWVRERHPDFHVRGATKIYRRACWDAIGGLHRVAGWDTLDEVKANMLGWQTRSFGDLHVRQHRFTGDAAGQWSNWVKNGRASYIAGYHPLFLFAKALARLPRRPHATASLGLLFGFARAWLQRTARIDDPELIRYVQRQQLRRLVGLSTVWR